MFVFSVCRLGYGQRHNISTIYPLPQPLFFNLSTSLFFYNSLLSLHRFPGIGSLSGWLSESFAEFISPRSIY
jgi:hypothetical protein